MKAIEIAKKDIFIEFRSKNTLNLMVLFSLVASMMFSVSVPVSVANDVAPALLWLIFIFVGMLGYARAFIREVELETLDGLRISPVNPASIVVGKILYNLTLMLITEAIVLPIFMGVFDLSIARLDAFIAAITLGNVAFVIATSSLAILVIKSRSRELLLPVIIFPVVFPIISSTILALNLAMQGDVSEIGQPISVITSFSVVALVVAMLTSEYAFTE
ncbi:heme exporter protein CcmB [Archaeoglobus veneficus]|uniref:Cytochrome c-type biogenesis protein CcmB n=1 Tax=Archaeoglobus veneficus (strain DSM 11195 / SNP6) TaxID=693661 RepID=F2KNH6_ARCVS|nr:heme exporter protein CcmB [Archaeoglobus veneficus]AEA47378.1 cytochrome c-type biogenesis protein CcmB [Archaeoglobus veneficus SNP6]